MPSLEFLDQIDVQAQAQFETRVERLAQMGRISNTQQFKILKDPGRPPVAEIKLTPGPGYRFYCIQQGRTWYVTHGTQKPPGSKGYTKEIKKARQLIGDLGGDDR